MDSTQIARIKNAADKLALTLTEQPATRDSFLQDPVNTISRLAPTLIEGLDEQQLATLGTQLKNDKYLLRTTTSNSVWDKERDKIRCYSCRIGLNAAIVGLGAGAIAALIAGGTVSAPVSLPFIDFFVSWGLSQAVATTVVAGGLAAAGAGVVGVIEAMVDEACSAIPHTCE
jgi:hypothetical protein